MSKQKSALHVWTNAFCPRRVRTLKLKTPSGVCIFLTFFQELKDVQQNSLCRADGKTATTFPVFWKERKLHFPQLHSREQLCRSYSCTQSTERNLQNWEQLHKHQWDFLDLIAEQVSNLKTQGSVSITDTCSCSQPKSKLAFNLAKKVKREVEEEEISIRNFFFFC